MMKLYCVQASTAFETIKIAITAPNARIAQRAAARSLETMYQVAPAKWKRGSCGALVRTFCYTGNSFDDAVEDDGFRAIVYTPTVIL